MIQRISCDSWFTPDKLYNIQFHKFFEENNNNINDIVGQLTILIFVYYLVKKHHVMYNYPTQKKKKFVTAVRVFVMASTLFKGSNS